MFGLWQPRLGSEDDGDWRDGFDEGTPDLQREEGDLNWAVSSKLSKYDGNAADGSAPRLDAGVEM